MIVVPSGIIHGLVTALHLYFKHPKPHQLNKLFDRYFYGIGSSMLIDQVSKNCEQCNSLIHIPKEIFDQSTTLSPPSVGSKFAADVIRRKSQVILVVRDVLSSYTTSSIITDERGDTLRSALLLNTTPIRQPTCTIRVDNAPGFITLKNDHLLKANGVTLDFK